MTSPARRVVLCLDLDAFFASVEIADDPALADPRRPLAVGSPDPHRGVISTASYAARAYGVRSGMSTAEALRRCPALRVVPTRHERYAEASEQVFAILRRVTDQIEPASVDEAYLDATGVLAPGQEPAVLAAELRRVIKAETRLTASIGIGAGKRMAKIACDRAKPDGILTIPAGTERAFLAPLPVSVISGVGPKTTAVLASNAITTCAELAATDPSHLRRWFGPKGAWMRDAAAGIDLDPVTPHRGQRSVGAEMTMETNTAATEALEALLAALAADVARRLERAGLFARGVTLKLRDADFRTITRSASIPDGTADAEVLLAAGCELLAREAGSRVFRLVGLTATGLAEGEQLRLFAREVSFGAPPAGAA